VLLAYGGPVDYVTSWLRQAGQADDRLFHLYVAIFLLDLMSEHGQAFNSNQIPSTPEARASLLDALRATLRRIARWRPCADDRANHWRHSLRGVITWSETTAVLAGLVPAVYAVRSVSPFRTGRRRRGVDGRDETSQDDWHAFGKTIVPLYQWVI
jgi:hypothetical protein